MSTKHVVGHITIFARPVLIPTLYVGFVRSSTTPVVFQSVLLFPQCWIHQFSHLDLRFRTIFDGLGDLFLWVRGVWLLVSLISDALCDFLFGPALHSPCHSFLLLESSTIRLVSWCFLPWRAPPRHPLALVFRGCPKWRWNLSASLRTLAVCRSWLLFVHVEITSSAIMDLDVRTFAYNLTVYVSKQSSNSPYDSAWTWYEVDVGSLGI